MSRRAWIAVAGLALAAGPAAALALPESAAAHALVGKQDLPIPTWLFAWGASLVLIVSFALLSVAWKQPASAAGPLAPRERLGSRRAAAQPRDRGAGGSARRGAADHRRLLGPGGDRGSRPQLLADLRLRHVLARAGAAERALRRRLPRLQPVARDRAHLLGRVPARRAPVASSRARLSRAPRPLAGRRRHPRLRLAGARLRGQRAQHRPAARDRGGRDPRLHGDHVRGDGPVRGRALDREGGGVLGLLPHVLDAFAARGSRRAAGAAQAAGGRHPLGERARLAGAGAGHDRRDQLRRRHRGRAGEPDHRHLRRAARRRPGRGRGLPRQRDAVDGDRDRRRLAAVPARHPRHAHGQGLAAGRGSWRAPSPTR